MKSSKTMAFQVVGDVAVLVHTSEPPAMDEWQSLVNLFGRGAVKRSLVVTFGGGPNSVQRSMLMAQLREQPVPTVVLSDNALARGIVTAMSWLGHDTRALPINNLDDAVRQLQRQPLQAELAHAVSTLRAELGV